MNNPRPFHRRIAIVLLAIFLPSLLPVNLLYASNNGPVAPEAASFEPVDATDMVNLVTGDMSYVLPVLNIPSPEGGYPLSLAYHAGIAIDQESSWTGLGWNINPGAINRSVSGVPDDWYRTKINQVLYNAGGEATSFSGSLSVGWDNAYSIGLYAAYSENKTFGGTTTYSFDGGITGSANGLNASVGTDGASIGAGYFSINQSFKNGSTGANFSISGVGISWNSENNFSGNILNQNIAISNNSYAKTIFSSSNLSFSISIPIYAVNIGLGFKKSKYWSYQREFTRYDGALYSGDMPSMQNEELITYNAAFDSYNSIYKSKSEEQLDDDNLSYVSYDNYSVSGQGISGSFRPSIYEQGSLINNYKANNPQSKSTITYINGANNSFTKKVNNSNNDIHFYFDNENVSFLKTSTGNWDISDLSTTPIRNITPLNQSLENLTTIDGVVKNGYNSAIKRKRTGSVIDAFTNEEILANSSLILQPTNYNRTNSPSKGIGAFRVTALDGKVYHYSIPVYQKQKFTKSTDLSSSFDHNYLEFQQLESYATHWLLTAITGPDYVDTNLNNQIDDNDYGYWVEFDYGKWSDGFAWNTPVKNMEDGKVYEWGVKEIYYLDKIKTRTHTALFVKSERQDDKAYELKIGESENDMSWDSTTSRSFAKDKNGNWQVKGIYENHPVFLTSSVAYYFPKSSFGKYIEFKKHKSLKLDKILLFKNKELNNLNIQKNIGNQTSGFFGKIAFKENFELFFQTQKVETWQNSNSSTVYGEFYNNVFDKNDINISIENKAIKSVDLNYATTNLLAKGSRNSDAPSKGRLTLESVQFLGKNRSKILPPYKFEYINSLSYDSNEEDNWGLYKGRPEMWSLNKIKTPIGSDINIVYESDDVEREAVTGNRGFDKNIEFLYYINNGRLRILARNEYESNNINFLNHFQSGTSVALDLWIACRHEYYDWGCKSRKVSIDINQNVDVVSVTSNSVLFETTIINNIYESNGGFGWFENNIIGYKNHPNMILEPYSRGSEANPNGCIGNSDRLVLYYNFLGNKVGLNADEKNGGGIRVKELSISQNNTIESKTKYFYNLPGYDENKTDSNYKSSGITSYIPQKYFKEIKYRTELPSPGVMYEYVTVKNYSKNNTAESIQQYNFEVLTPDSYTLGMSNFLGINNLSVQKNQAERILNASSNSESYDLYLSRYSILDKTAYLGRLKEKITMNGDKHILSKVVNKYKNSTSLSQGITEESFNSYKRISNNNNITYRLSITSKLKYPSVLESSTLTQGGYSNTVYYDEYDFLTGQVLQTRNIDSYGKTFKTKTVPAYQKYSNMGSKVDNSNNANMLSQVAASYSYIQDNGVWKETGVGITTWNNEWVYQDLNANTTSPTNPKEKIWRKHKTYTWNGVTDSNGIFLNYDATNNADDGFIWTVGVGTVQPSQWKQTSEVTLYDHYSKPLEVKDINGNKAATKMDVFNEKVQATGNAGYNEMYYSGAEESIHDFYVGQEVRLTNANTSITSNYAHTGKNSVAATDATQFGVFMYAGHRRGKYKISVWAHKNNYQKARLRWFNNDVGNTFEFNGEKYFAGDWVLLNHYVDANYMDLNNTAAYWYVNSIDSTTVYFDDLMIRPIASAITGYVYNEYDELTHIINNNGLATRFEYDAAGRLVKTYTEILDDPANGVTGGFKLSTKSKINYRHMN